MVARNRRLLALAGGIGGSVLLIALLLNIFERKVESRNPFYKVVEISDDIDDPAVWGKNFPHQYDGYLKTADMSRTKYGGSEAVAHVPTEKDPRNTTSQQKTDEDPRLKALWAGYAFAYYYPHLLTLD